MMLRRLLPVLWIWLPLATVAGIGIIAGVGDYRNGPWLFAIACWAVLDVSWALAAKQSPSTPAGSSWPLISLAAWLPYALYCLPLSSIPILGQRFEPRLMALGIVGAVLSALGLAIAIWARWVLSGNWSGGVAPAGSHALVQHGPYAFVRHPVYLGLLMMMAGMILALGELRAVVLIHGMIRLLTKATEEEVVLRAAYPSEYPLYARRVRRRLVPWIW